MKRRELVLALCGGVAGALIGASAVTLSAQTADIGDVAYRNVQHARAYRARGISEREVDDEWYNRAKVREEYQPTFAPEAAEERTPEAECAVRVPLILDLETKIGTLFPSGQQALTGLKQGVDAAFDAALEGCLYTFEEEVQVEEAGEAASVKRYNNHCEQYREHSTRRVLCDVKQSRNEPFIGGQTKWAR